DIAARLGEVDLAPLLRLRSPAGREHARRRLRDPADRRQAQADALDRLRLGAEAVDAVVLRVEAPGEIAARRNRELVALPDVAHVEPADELDRVLGDTLATAETERLRAALLDRAPGAVDVELDLAAEEVLRVEPAEDDIRVRDGRLDAAAAVTDRAGIRACALRPDPQQPARVDPGDGAAAGADLDEVDDRGAD